MVAGPTTPLEVLRISIVVDPISPALSSPRSVRSRRKSSVAHSNTEGEGGADDEDDDGSGDDAFGDDFDDFEEGDEEAEFDDFDDGFQEPVTPAAPPSSAPAVQPLSFVRLTLFGQLRPLPKLDTKPRNSQYRTLTGLTQKT